MTANEFARLLDARRTDAGRWQAKCPAHDDRSPSLSVKEGEDGRVLVHCFAGCCLAAILAALELAPRDLFAGPPPQPQQQAALRAAREASEIVARMERKARREAWDRARKWVAVVNELGAKLARNPQDEALASVFHTACDRLRESEAEAEKWNPVRRVIAKVEGRTNEQSKSIPTV